MWTLLELSTERGQSSVVIDTRFVACACYSSTVPTLVPPPVSSKQYIKLTRSSGPHSSAARFNITCASICTVVEQHHLRLDLTLAGRRSDSSLELKASTLTSRRLRPSRWPITSVPTPLSWRATCVPPPPAPRRAPLSWRRSAVMIGGAMVTGGDGVMG